MNINKFIRSIGFAIDGLKLAVNVDQNVRIHLVVGLVVLIVSVIIRVPKLEFIFIIFTIFFVLITEMLNTAIEEMTNLIKVEHSMEARIAKDVAAGAVLLAALFAVIVGFLILLPRLLTLL